MEKNTWSSLRKGCTKPKFSLIATTTP